MVVPKSAADAVIDQLVAGENLHTYEDMEYRFLLQKCIKDIKVGCGLNDESKLLTIHIALRSHHNDIVCQLQWEFE